MQEISKIFNESASLEGANRFSLKSLARKAESLPDLLAAVPEKDRIIEFITRIPTIDFLKPDGRTEPDWVVFPERTLDSAWKTALFNAQEDIQHAAPGTWEPKTSDWEGDRDTVHGVFFEAFSPPVRGVARRKEHKAANTAMSGTERCVAWSAVNSLAWELTRQGIEKALRSLPPEVNAPPSFARNIMGSEQLLLSAVCDAAHLADMLLISDLIDKKAGHVEHAESIWRVWERGGMLPAEVNGLKYVGWITSTNK